MKSLIVLSVAACCAHAATDLFGPSGALLDGGLTQVQHKEAGVTPLLDGPSAIVWSDGSLTQKRGKRSAQHLIGESGAVLADGTQVQFSEGNAEVLLEGPSGIIWSDGTITQKRAKRSATSGVSAKELGIEVPQGVSVVLAGSSHALLSDGSVVPLRTKRSTPGAPAYFGPDGTPVQLPAGITVASAGASGVVLSDGTQIQF